MSTWLTWPLRAVGFVVWYAWEFVLANYYVVVETLRPTPLMKATPAIVAVPAASKTDSEYALIATLITLTPGTLTITLSKEAGILYVHGMFVESRESFAEEIQEMEARMLRGMRRVPGDLTLPVERPVVRPSDMVRADTDQEGGDEL